MPEGKDVILEPLGSGSQVGRLIGAASNEGVKGVVFSTKNSGHPKGIRFIRDGADATVTLTSSIEDLRRLKNSGIKVGFEVVLSHRKDQEKAVEGARLGADMVIIDAKDWKIIPLENIVAEMQGLAAKLYAKIRSGSEARTMFSVLERGVDGVVLATSKVDDIRLAVKEAAILRRVELQEVEVIEVREVGLGERVCVDSASILREGEGLLVGSQSNFLFLMHNEAVGSQFTSPRPFRVNAGAVHSYTLLPNGKTKYLSELEGGHEILAVSRSGGARVCVTGRVKIERRPLTLVKADIDGQTGSALVQNAETIAFVSSKKVIPVTALKPGDKVLARTEPSSGRHFGLKVDEFILEK